MQATRMMLALLLISFLSGCRSTLNLTTEQCSPSFAYVEVDIVHEMDGLRPLEASIRREIIDPEKSICFCRRYTFSRHYVGPENGTTVEHPLDYCNKIVGFTDYATVTTFWEKVRREILSNE